MWRDIFMDKLNLDLEHQWMQIQDDVVTIGLADDTLFEFDQIVRLTLPSEESEVLKNDICGEIQTSDGPVTLYSPISGTIIEANSTLLDNPSKLLDDPLCENWLYRIRANNPDELSLLKEETEFLEDEDDIDDDDDFDDDDLDSDELDDDDFDDDDFDDDEFDDDNEFDDDESKENDA